MAITKAVVFLILPDGMGLFGLFILSKLLSKIMFIVFNPKIVIDNEKMGSNSGNKFSPLVIMVAEKIVPKM